MANNSVVDFSDAFSKVERSVFGIGYHVGPQFVINGTGFVIHESGWLITNKHVLDPLLIKNSDGSLSITPASRALQFVVIQRNEAGAQQIGYANTRIIELFWIQQQHPSVPIDQREKVEINGHKADLVIPPEPPDIGIFKIDLSLLPPESLPLTPVHIVPSKGLKIGTPVGILGFPQGLHGPVVNSIMDMQCCPILQTGCVSAVLPHPDISKPSQVLLDIYIHGGSSGSPLFNLNGDVLGAVFAARQEFAPLLEVLPNGDKNSLDNTGVYLGTSIGCAVPSLAFAEEINKKFPNLVSA